MSIRIEKKDSDPVIPKDLEIVVGDAVISKIEFRKESAAKNFWAKPCAGLVHVGYLDSSSSQTFALSRFVVEKLAFFTS